MAGMPFSVEVAAPVAHVWASMLDDSPSREWTSSFHPGSFYRGDWSKGSEMRFIGPDDRGAESGLGPRVVENRPLEFISLEYTAEIIAGEDRSFDAEMLRSHENYTFREADGVTTVTVDPDSHSDMSEMFAGIGPPALASLKENAERPVAS